MGNVTSRMITGIMMIVVGLGLTILALFTSLAVLIYGLPILIIGIVILFNKNEDQVEGIKKGGGGILKSPKISERRKK